MERQRAMWLYQDIKRAQGYIKAIRADLRSALYDNYVDQCMASDEIAFQVSIIQRAREELRNA